MKGRLLDDVEVDEENDPDHGNNNDDAQQQLLANEEEEEEEENDDDINPGLVHEFMTELDKIPFEDKVEYLQALTNNEALFETECNPIRFLRYTDYDPELAAKRMTKYWQMRVALFGQARAFLPMTLTGALHDDLEEWQTQVPDLFYFLPNDIKGRTVICINKTDNTKTDGISPKLMPRIFWYMFHLAMRRQFARTNGCVVVHISRILSLSQFNRKQAKMCVISIKDCIPIKVSAVHTVPSGVVAKLIVPVMKRFLSKSIRTRIKVHDVGLTGTYLMEDLQPYGLRRVGLPKSIGGLYEVNPNWLQERLQFEEVNGF